MHQSLPHATALSTTHGICCLDEILLNSSKINSLALISLTLLVVFCRSGSRKWAPHPVEVEAILQNNTKIAHKICFPNETEQVRTYLFFQATCILAGAYLKIFSALTYSSPLCNKSLVVLQTFDVGTNTKNRTLCQNIASKLQLSSWEGFSLFVKIADKVTSQLQQGCQTASLASFPYHLSNNI